MSVVERVMNCLHPSEPLITHISEAVIRRANETHERIALDAPIAVGITFWPA